MSEIIWGLPKVDLKQEDGIDTAVFYITAQDGMTLHELKLSLETKSHTQAIIWLGAMQAMAAFYQRQVLGKLPEGFTKAPGTDKKELN